MHVQNQTSEQTPHLAPALTAVILGVAVLAAFGAYARSLERRSIMWLAADEAIFEREGKLAPVKNHVTAITNLELRNAYPGTHATSNCSFLSAARVKES